MMQLAGRAKMWFNLLVPVFGCMFYNYSVDVVNKYIKFKSLFNCSTVKKSLQYVFFWGENHDSQ